MGIKKETIERIVNGKKHIFYPEEIKIEIVKDLEKGKLSVKEATIKYGIHSSATIFGWLKTYSEKYRNEQMRVLYPQAERRGIARKVASGVMSIEVAEKQYRIKKGTIKDWITLYGCESIPKEDMSKKKNHTEPLTGEEEIKRLQKQIAFLKLKVEGLETLIDISERDFKIDILKKGGAKQ